MVTNETDMVAPATPAGPDGATSTRVLSDADLALFALLAGHLDLSAPATLSLDATPRQPVPQALLAGLLSAEAVRVAGPSSHARVASAALRFAEQAYSDEPLRINAHYSVPDPAGALHVEVAIHSADERLLASGTVLVIPG